MKTRLDRLGLPDHERLKSFRIWDSYFTPAYGDPGVDFEAFSRDVECSLPAIQKAVIEKLCYFAHVGIGTCRSLQYERAVTDNPSLVLRPLQKWPERLIGMIQLNANRVDVSLAAIDRWLGDGPMLGVYFAGDGPGALPCVHRNCRLLIERVMRYQGVIMQHTWYKTGGKQGPGESTPAELATVAMQYPEQSFLCAHAGGEWEQGIRAVQDQPNILVETSGFDATAGFIEFAVEALGDQRIIFGSHLPSRSLGTELGKIVGANITEKSRIRILGENYRRLIQRAQAAKRV